MTHCCVIYFFSNSRELKITILAFTCYLHSRRLLQLHKCRRCSGIWITAQQFAHFRVIFEFQWVILIIYWKVLVMGGNKCVWAMKRSCFFLSRYNKLKSLNLNSLVLQLEEAILKESRVMWHLETLKSKYLPLWPCLVMG